jgi:hypothetical protein
MRAMSAIGLALGAAFFAFTPVGYAQDGDVVEVTADGEGTSEDYALKDALRKALERGAGMEISSHSQTKNFELIRDTIYARADGLVTDYTILEKGAAAGGTFFVKIRARVRKDAVARSWGEVQSVLDQLGQPGIAIYILETIDGVRQESSILEAQLEERLLAKGFLVYAGEQLREKLKRDGFEGELDRNPDRILDATKGWGVPIYITGTANANAAGTKELAGQRTAMYNGDVMFKMYYTDSAQLITTVSDTNMRGGARGQFTHSPQAGKMALKNAAEELVERAYETVMRRWAERISYGGQIELEIEQTNAAEAFKIKKMLEAIEGLRVSGPKLTRSLAKFQIHATMTAEQLVGDHLVQGEWATLLDIYDVQMNRIKARVQAPPGAPGP